jgi:hypothetical protein
MIPEWMIEGETNVEIQAVQIEVQPDAGMGASSEDAMPVKKGSASDAEHLPLLSPEPQQPPK